MVESRRCLVDGEVMIDLIVSMFIVRSRTSLSIAFP